MKRLVKFLTSKVTIISFLSLLQIAFFVFAIYLLSSEVPYFIYFSLTISLVLVVVLLRGEEPEVYKTAWIIPILIAPIFGGFFYLTFKPLNVTKKLSVRFKEKDKNRKTQMLAKIKDTPDVKETFQKQIQYLQNDVWPYYSNTNITFLPSGESKLKHVIEELKQATKFIFLEYFILEEGGLTWESIYPVLIEKVNQGVDVRLIYDDWGSSIRLKRNFKKRMENSGIKIVVFNPLKLRFIVAHNYRDHKKMIIIDGNIAFTGGINIADEYINVKKKFGHWHDTAIMLKGEAVQNMTASFLETWDFYHNETTNLKDFEPTISVPSDAIVIPYTDSPFSKNFLSKNLYNQIIYSAKKEIFITTPYFIIDNEMLNAFKTQALSGVKIHIIVPGIPDKKFAYRVTEYYLKQLVHIQNIYIYSYTPGFIHSKLLYVDDQLATIGTVNFDFRSFYLHFENNVLFYHSDALCDIKRFLIDTIDKSKLLTFQDLHKNNPFYKIYETLLVSLSHLL